MFAPVAIPAQSDQIARPMPPAIGHPPPVVDFQPRPAIRGHRATFPAGVIITLQDGRPENMPAVRAAPIAHAGTHGERDDPGPERPAQTREHHRPPLLSITSPRADVRPHSRHPAILKQYPGFLLFTAPALTYVYNRSPGHRFSANFSASKIKTLDKIGDSFLNTAQFTPTCPLLSINFLQTNNASHPTVISTIFSPGPTNSRLLGFDGSCLRPSLYG